MIKAQRHKAKFKFALDDFSIMPFSVSKLTGQSEIALHRMLKKPLNYEIPGPLLMRTVFNNEKIQYYAKRYCPIKEKKPLNFHPSFV